MSEKSSICNAADQNCYSLSEAQWKHCAKVIKGVDECYLVGSTWNHYPDSPYGDVEICPHGVTRDHGDTKPQCIYCDYPEDSVWTTEHCPNCNTGLVKSHFLNGKCLRCGK